MSGEDRVRALIRLIPAARALEQELEKSMHLEIYHGTGDAAIASVKGIQAQLARIAEDAYVAALPVEPPRGADDKQKVAVALLVAAQIRGYLEGETGLLGIGGGGHEERQYAPRVLIQGNSLPSQQMEHMLGLGRQKKAGEEQDSEPG